MLVSLSVLPAWMGGDLLAEPYAASPSTACLPAVSWMGGHPTESTGGGTPRSDTGHRVGPGAPAQAVGAAVAERAVRAVAGAAAPSATACAAACCYCAYIAGGAAACESGGGAGSECVLCSRALSAWTRAEWEQAGSRAWRRRKRAARQDGSKRARPVCGLRLAWGRRRAHPRRGWTGRSAPARRAPGAARAARAACSAIGAGSSRVVHVAASRCGTNVHAADSSRPPPAEATWLPAPRAGGGCRRGAADGERRARRGGARWRGAAGGARRAGRGGRVAVGGAHTSRAR
jgi:hypothetical protein